MFYWKITRKRNHLVISASLSQKLSFSKKLLKSVESAKLRFDKHISSQKLEESLDGKKNNGKLL